MDIHVKKFKEVYPNDVLLSIWEESFPTLDEKRIKWAYQENVCGKAQVWLLKDKASNDYIGCSALIPRYFYVNGKRILGALFADTGIKNKFRMGIPIFTLQRKIINDSQDFKFLMGFPVKVLAAMLKRLGFRKAKDIICYVKVIKSSLILEKKIKSKFLKNILLPWTIVADLILQVLNLRITFNKKRFESKHIHTFDKRIDSIFEHAKAKYSFIQERSSDFMNWRYKSHPYRNFYIFVINTPGSADIVGYIVYYVKEDRVFVEDFLWLNGLSTLKDLICEFTKSMQKKKYKSISFFIIEDKKYDKLFKRLGFFIENNLKRRIPFLYFSSDENQFENISRSIQNSFITIGDRDW